MCSSQSTVISTRRHPALLIIVSVLSLHHHQDVSASLVVSKTIHDTENCVVDSTMPCHRTVHVTRRYCAQRLSPNPSRETQGTVLYDASACLTRPSPPPTPMSGKKQQPQTERRGWDACTTLRRLPPSPGGGRCRRSFWPGQGGASCWPCECLSRQPCGATDYAVSSMYQILACCIRKRYKQQQQQRLHMQAEAKIRRLNVRSG